MIQLALSDGTTPWLDINNVLVATGHAGIEDIFKGNSDGHGNYDGGNTTRTVAVWAYNTGDTARKVTLHGATFTDATAANSSGTSPSCGSLIATINAANIASAFVSADALGGQTPVSVASGGTPVRIGTLTVTYNDNGNVTDGCVGAGGTLTYTLS